MVQTTEITDSPYVLSETPRRSRVTANPVALIHLSASVISCTTGALCLLSPSSATRDLQAHQPMARAHITPWKPSWQGSVSSHAIRPSCTEGLLPNHLLGRGHAKLLNRAWEGFGRVLIGRERAMQCAKHSTARSSQCQCPGMFPGCISLDGASLCKSHCNKQIPLPKTSSFATKEHLLVRLGMQKSAVNFSGF